MSSSLCVHRGRRVCTPSFASGQLSVQFAWGRGWGCSLLSLVMMLLPRHPHGSEQGSCLLSGRLFLLCHPCRGWRLCCTLSGIWGGGGTAAVAAYSSSVNKWANATRGTRAKPKQNDAAPAAQHSTRLQQLVG